MSNAFGVLFRLTTFGESHGPAIGGVIDGCPAGLALDESVMQRELDRRRPGIHNPASTARHEEDRARILSGLFEGRTTGAPIAFLIENKEHNPADYEKIKDIHRPGQADYPWQAKYGRRDWRGGGRASARETAARVAGGAVALALLEQCGIKIRACTQAIGGLEARLRNPELAEESQLGAPDPEIVPRWEELIASARAAGNSLGGVVRLEAHGLPPGLGEPVFDKLDARIGTAMFGVGAVKGVEIGAGFAAASMMGSENNDPMRAGGKGGESQPQFLSNHAGGVLGGLSTGQPLLIRVGIKPIPSIAKAQESVNSAGENVNLEMTGRHDVCAIPRINPVLKAMLALTLADFILLQRARTFNFEERPADHTNQA